MTNLRISVLWT